MNKLMPDSYKNEVEEFKQWADNRSQRISDSKSGVSPRPRHERPYEVPTPALKNIIDSTFN